MPGDVSVVGFDAISLGENVTPALTSVVQPRYEAGRMAFGLLLERIRDGYAGPRRTITLETRLDVRESTAPPPLGRGGRFRSCDQMRSLRPTDENGQTRARHSAERRELLQRLA